MSEKASKISRLFPEQQRFIYKGKGLESHKTLSNYDI